MPETCTSGSTRGRRVADYSVADRPTLPRKDCILPGMGISAFASTRRRFFRHAGLAGAIGSLPGGQRLALALAAKTAQDSMKVYTRLGLRPIINASGTYTHLGGSLMPQEVLDAMDD